jgi:hypothetical protein
MCVKDPIRETELALKAVHDLLASPVLSKGTVLQLEELKSRLKMELAELKKSRGHAANGQV